MKGHGLLERDGRRYCYRLTDKGKRVAAMFVLFQQRIRGPLANSLFHHRPENAAQPPAKIETAYHRAAALFDATGKVVRRLPLKPEYVQAVLKA